MGMQPPRSAKELCEWRPAAVMHHQHEFVLHSLQHVELMKVDIKDVQPPSGHYLLDPSLPSLRLHYVTWLQL